MLTFLGQISSAVFFSLSENHWIIDKQAMTSFLFSAQTIGKVKCIRECWAGVGGVYPPINLNSVRVIVKVKCGTNVSYHCPLIFVVWFNVFITIFF